MVMMMMMRRRLMMIMIMTRITLTWSLSICSKILATLAVGFPSSDSPCWPWVSISWSRHPQHQQLHHCHDPRESRHHHHHNTVIIMIIRIASKRITNYHHGPRSTHHHLVNGVHNVVHLSPVEKINQNPFDSPLDMCVIIIPLESLLLSVFPKRHLSSSGLSTS